MKRPQVILAAVAAIIIGLFWFTYTRHREPHYEGKSLSEWLSLYWRHPAGAVAIAPVVSQEAAAAVRHIGTNALPFLLTWVQQAQDMTPRRQHLFEMVRHWKVGMPGREFLLELIGRRQDRAERAFRGFAILGETARNAAPDLARVATHGDTTGATIAINALPCLGRDGFHALVSVLTNTVLPLSREDQVLNTLGRVLYMATDERPGIVALIRCLDEPPLANSAALTLGTLHLEGEISVPALIGCARSTNATLRITAVTSLGEFGRDARPAVPDLTKLLGDPDAALRQAATNALERIAADASGP